MKKFYLYDGKGGSISVEIINDCLKFFDHMFSGPLEKEQWWDFDEINTEKLVKLLTIEDCDLKKVLLKNYSGLEGFKKLQKLWKENNIECDYNAWTHMDFD